MSGRRSAALTQGRTAAHGNDLQKPGQLRRFRLKLESTKSLSFHELAYRAAVAARLTGMASLQAVSNSHIQYDAKCYLVLL